jgi:sRNA-binding protein
MVDNQGLTQGPFMTTPTSETAETAVPTAPQTPASQAAKKPDRLKAVQPVLEQLFALYPQLFGANFLPLKLGIFQELLAKHPEQFQRDSLKAALGVHTRSTRYLQCVAEGKPRHDLQGLAVEPVAAEHICLALLELFRRRQLRSPQDLRPKLRAQLKAAFANSGLTRGEYLSKIQLQDPEIQAVLEQALADHEQTLARQEALKKAFETSGKTVQEFAAMYGMTPREVTALLGPKPTLAEKAV